MSNTPASFGTHLLDQSKAHPGSIDKSIFQPKSAPVGQGTTSSDYLEKTRADNPEPEDKQKDAAPPVLSNCRFVTPVEELRAQEEFDMAVDVKIPAGSTVTAQATFTLFCFVPPSGTEAGSGKEERSKIWTVEGKVDGAGGDSVVVKARRTLMPELGATLGGKTAFELEATHPDLQEPCKSPRVEVVLKTVAHWVGGDDLHFRSDGEFPLLGSDGVLLKVLATAVGRIKKPAQEGETVICFGFASGALEADANSALSLRRAQAVKALLERDESGWSTLAKSNFETRDLQQFLSDLHAACGWACDPGEVDGVDGPQTKAAITSFQEECNARYGLGLKVDGVCGPKTWGAVLRAIVGQVQDVLGEDSSKAPAWPKPKWGAGGEGVYGNGEDFATGGDKPEERSVQITFLAPGAEQPLKKAPSGQKATPKENPHQDEKLVEKRKIGNPELARKTFPPKGPTLHVGLFFDGTWNNRNDDLPKKCESNIAKLFELFDADLVTKFRYYYEGVGTENVLVSDMLSGGLGGRGAQERIDRAFADLKKLLQRDPGARLDLSLFGFSRGAATARSFVNQLYASPDRIGPSELPFARISFMGLFDTVGSFGMPGDFDEAGHDLSVHTSRIARLVHLVARDEKRSLFPLTSIHVPGENDLPAGWEERIYPGVHSDLGGGYGNTKSRDELQAYETDARFRQEREQARASANFQVHSSEKPNLAKLEAEAPRDCLSRIPFWVLFDLASKAGVPFHKLEAILPPPSDAHSPDWWHLAPEEEKRKATWVRFSGRRPESLTRLEIPPRLRTYWEKRHQIAHNGAWNGEEREMQDIAFFQHDSLYMWEDENQERRSKDRGVND